MGDMGRKKIRDANEKRRAFYETAKEQAVQKAYREKAAKKRQIVNQLAELKSMSLKLKSKSCLQLEIIQSVINICLIMIRLFIIRHEFTIIEFSFLSFFILTLITFTHNLTF